MGRPRTFDRDEALDQALKTFWHHGYEATSVQDLVDAMGVSRASIYNTFGGKHDLYVEALRRYDQETVERLLGILRSADTPRQGLRDLFETIADDVAECPKKGGCFITNTATELGSSDDEAVQHVRRNFQRIEDAFASVLRDYHAAPDTSETPPDDVIASQARFLLNSLQGLRVLAKTSPDRDELQGIVEMTLGALDTASARPMETSV